MANVFQRALRAFRAAGDAHGASVMDNLVRVVDPFLLWNHLHQVLLNVFRIGTLGQLQPARDAMDLRIYDHANCLLEPWTQDDLRRLTCDAGTPEPFARA